MHVIVLAIQYIAAILMVMRMVVLSGSPRGGDLYGIRQRPLSQAWPGC